MEKSSSLPYVNMPETIGYPPDKSQTEELLRKMADRILNNTTWHFINEETRETYKDSDQLPVSEKIKLESGYNDWKYWNGVSHIALNGLSKLLDDERYRNYVIENYKFAFTHLKYFEKLFSSRIPNAPFHQFFRLDRLDDFGAMGAGLHEVINDLEEPAYNEYLDRVTHYIKYQQDRLNDGTFCRNRFGYTALWGDDLYMSIPFLVRAWKRTGDDELIEDAVKQVFLFHQYLFDTNKELFYHYRIMQTGHPGVAHWGRANGWMIVAQCELLNALPANHDARNQLIELLKKQIVGLSRYQSGNGMWRQLLDKTDSFHESSCTAMITYGIARAVNQGWIDDIYASIAVSAWQGLAEACIKPDGEFDLVSTGFNFKQDLAYYYNRPIEPGGDHGVGAAIMAGIEIYQLKEYRDCVWC